MNKSKTQILKSKVCYLPFVFCACFAVYTLASGINFVFAEEAKQNQEAAQPAAAAQEKPREFAGQFFDVKVPQENYIFIKTTHMIFGDQGIPVKTEEEREARVWDDLLLSYEAFRRGVNVSQEEIDEEVNKILAAEKVTFDFKKDRKAYEEWLKVKTNEPIELFENQLRHLIQMKKLRLQIMDGIEPKVEDKEAHEQFYKEHSSLSVEIVEFEKKEDAEAFYQKLRKNNAAWEEERKIHSKDFRGPGFVSLAFLIDIWKFPKDACYKMVKMKKGEFYPPQPIYKGWAVFRILEAKAANESEYPKVKNAFYEKIKNGKKYEGLGQWMEGLKKQANIVVYKKGGEGV